MEHSYKLGWVLPDAGLARVLRKLRQRDPRRRVDRRQAQDQGSRNRMKYSAVLCKMFENASDMK